MNKKVSTRTVAAVADVADDKPARTKWHRNLLHLPIDQRCEKLRQKTAKIADEIRLIQPEEISDNKDFDARGKMRGILLKLREVDHTLTLIQWEVETDIDEIAADYD